MKTLFETARNMPKNDPVVIFITNVLTESEQVMIGRRLLIAQMILEGKKQAEIIYELGVSPNTFSRTRKWLTGQIPEYDKALKEHRADQKLLDNNPNRTRSKPEDPFSFTALKNKYPTHFLLFSMMHKAKKINS